jgi:hypothetical protein
VCAGLCRAHGIPHQKVASAQELLPALQTAWGINRWAAVCACVCVRACAQQGLAGT